MFQPAKSDEIFLRVGTPSVSNYSKANVILAWMGICCIL